MTDATEAESVEIIPEFCTLKGHHGDGRSLLLYILAKQYSMVKARRIWSDACKRLNLSVEFVPDHLIEKFVSIMSREPFAFRILTKLVCDEPVMVQCADATDFLERFFANFP